MSLKNTILQTIRERHEISLDELYKLCDKIGMKHETSSRLLRRARNEIEPIYNKRNAIIAYKTSQTSNPAPTALKSECCYSMTTFGIHTKDCVLFEEMERTARILEAHTENQLKLIL